MRRVVLQPVGDHQLASGVAAGLHHPLRLRHTGRHRLLAQDVLAGRGRPLGELRMHRVGQDDIDDMHVGIVADRVEAFVVVDAFRRDAILRGDRQGFRPVAADERRATDVLRRRETRHDLLQRQVADADDGHAEPRARRLGIGQDFAAFARRVQGRQQDLAAVHLPEQRRGLFLSGGGAAQPRRGDTDGRGEKGPARRIWDRV